MLATPHPVIPVTPFPTSPYRTIKILATTSNSTILVCGADDKSATVLKICKHDRLYLNELAALSALSELAHPNIIQLVKDQHGSFLAHNNKLLLTPVGIDVSTQSPWRVGPIALALEAVHAAGFVHRDCRTSNIVMVRNDVGGRRRPVLCDFGGSQPIATASSLAAGDCAPLCFWPTPALEALSRGHEVPYRKEDDLHIFVRAVHALNNPLSSALLTANDPVKFADYWTPIFSGMPKFTLELLSFVAHTHTFRYL